MSTIGNSMLGLVQGQGQVHGHASTKGKAGHHSKNAGGAFDFADTVASLAGREGEGGKKGGRIALSITAEPKEATTEHATPLAKSADKADAKFADKTSGLHHGRKTAKEEDAGVDQADSTAPAVDGEAKTAPATDVGNLLELLAAPNQTQQAVKAAGGSGVAALLGEKTQAGAKVAAKAETAGADASAQTEQASGDDGAEISKSDSDKLFRLVRSDGKGRDVDMSISANGERATVRDANTAGPRGETVTVVEARRYIGLAQNSSAVTSTITQDPDWQASLSATRGLSTGDAVATGQVVNTLKIQMHPIELGLVTATLRLHGEALHVSLQVQSGEAYRQLSEDQDAIVKALRDQGFAVDQVSIQLQPMDRGAGTQQGDAQPQSQSQQQQQFSNDPQAREGGNGRERSPFAREEQSHETVPSETAPGALGNQSRSAGGVYL